MKRHYCHLAPFLSYHLAVPWPWWPVMLLSIPHHARDPRNLHGGRYCLHEKQQQTFHNHCALQAVLPLSFVIFCGLQLNSVKIKQNPQHWGLEDSPSPNFP